MNTKSNFTTTSWKHASWLLAALALSFAAHGRTFSDADWIGLGSGMGGSIIGSCSVYALAVSGTNLYAGGNFTTAGGVPANCIAKWNGSAWSPLGSGMDYCVYALAVSGADLYAGGAFTNAGGVRVNCIAKWDGSTWSPLGSGISPLYPYGTGGVRALAVSGTNLYAGGVFTEAGGVAANHIAKWDGTAWSALGSGMGWVQGAWVCALAVSGTNLYAGGVFTNAGGVPANNIAKWDGTAWSSLGSGVSGGSLPGTYALALIGSNIYTGFYISEAGGVPVNCIAQWNGSAWSALGSGLGNRFLPCLTALTVSGTDLYAGGQFTTAGGVPANYIAKWDGNAWSALGSGVNSQVAALAADGAGHLFVGGGFTQAGTNACSYIAEAILVPRVPTFLMLPPSQTAEAGTTVHFSMNAAGEPAPTYQWYFNGTNSLSCTSSNLVLTSILSSQSGAYTEVAINEAGAVTSAPVILNVIPVVDRRPAAGVKVMGEAGSMLDVDYASSLGATLNWLPLSTVTLVSTSQYCVDGTEPLPAQRFYRARQTGTPSVRPWLELHLVPAITLTGNIGSSVRVDCIKRFGPIDAWVTLDTVTLTNTSQLYFDTSAPGQPQRLYRLVQIP